MKKGIAILTLVSLLGTGLHLYKNSPYNNKNIKFIRNNKSYSQDLKDVLHNFNNFDEMMYDLAAGKAYNYTRSEIDEFLNILDKWLFK